MNDLIGTGVALVTPFNEDRSIDYSGLQRIIEHTISGGVDYLVVMGTTGESPTISWKEQLEALTKSIEFVDNRKPIVFGLGGNDTYALCEKSQELNDYPIAAILSASPYYNKPSQKGLIAHYEALADSSSFPILLYNVPARTGSNMEADTSIALSQHENIIGLKEASGDISQFEKVKKNVDDQFLMLSGDDSNTLETIRMGGHGVISVVANLIPKEFSQMVKNALGGQFDLASLENKKLELIYRLSVMEGNPTSIKTGLMNSGFIENYMRLPLTEGSDVLKKAFEEARA
ncbi:MAG: 4-hydroxy-tetrahydrodipicolinate synthase [Cyclobacteriaceae bacterium]